MMRSSDELAAVHSWVVGRGSDEGKRWRAAVNSMRQICAVAVGLCAAFSRWDGVRASEPVIGVNQVPLGAGAEGSKSLAVFLDALVEFRPDHGAGLRGDERFFRRRQSFGE